ncbi:hypothetical protein PYJP_16810 [Pyrofollis japonicus]|uniref:hypothetical protein n=1 Tax=Pyrofollis japonicus TaxID=3060460 RepID=UPI00295BF4B1|nr:hypothetical protein [Pyrofollis japonicus]BEP18329.1 hypothetical protein PYJP_16810 [Pyrofollis japonicus]
MENRREKLVKLLENALKPIIEPLGASIDSVESFEIDPYGPRIVVQLSPGNGVVSIFIDASPDGVEAVYSLRVDKGLDKQGFEEELSTLIEESEEFRGVEEYDVTYASEEGEVTITLRARMIAELPSISEVRKAVESASAKTSTPR